MRKLALIAGAAAVTLAAGAQAQDVRPPGGAAAGSIGGQITLPGTSQLESGRQIKTTAMEKKRFTGPIVDKQTILELRELAIEAGQSSSSGGGGEAAGPSAEEEATVDKASQSFFERVQERGGKVPGSG